MQKRQNTITRTKYIPKRTKEPDFDQKKVNRWLRQNAQKAKTEGPIIVAQDLSLGK